MNVTEEDIERMLKAALDARLGAYAPYSKFAVGAAVITGKRKIYTGANIENASYGLTVCAERMAIGTAVNAGHSDLQALLVVGGNIEEPDKSRHITPCGACRQVMVEFMSDDAVIISAALDGSHEPVILKNLLPKAFKLEEF